MQKKSVVLSSFASNSDKTIQAAADASPDGRTGARASVRRAAGRTCVEVAKGSSPTNREPYNCNNEYFKLLRFGVDSLYLSYQGDLFPEIQERLTKLKQLAQHPEINQQALAQFTIAGHVFEVKDKGPKLFPFVLVDGAFQIQLSRAAKKLPMAYVKLSSRYLCSVTPQEAESHLRAILSEFGTLTDSAHVSRIDLCADFVSNENMESWKREAWVTRGKKKDAHAVEDDFTGWSIGLGGIMSFRLYNKLLEVADSGRNDLFPVWEAAGWKEGEPIWRGEFQFRREVLAQHGVIRLEDVLANLNGLWSYASTEWLRLTIPNPDDLTRSRWPVHPLWGYLTSVDWETNGGVLTRSFKATRLPEDKRIFSLGASSISSYMAKHGITDYGDGLDRYLFGLYSYLQTSGDFIGLPAEGVLLEKVRLKGKEFNTIQNRLDAEWVRLENVKTEDAYRKATKGGNDAI
ncbi:MAG: replication initiation factor [Candidatus Nitrotoga sp.]|nr:replication initiation factor [Candidatus Nitrotoga sp.]MDO9447288.1 replication initiation factor [Candidatus Nitrotoga sp.]MDP3496160.1 replication initiation factor [Candidatus Nitrotoga sp.]